MTDHRTEKARDEFVGIALLMLSSLIMAAAITSVVWYVVLE
jgi:hypothetical protein